MIKRMIIVLSLMFLVMVPVIAEAEQLVDITSNASARSGSSSADALIDNTEQTVWESEKTEGVEFATVLFERCYDIAQVQIKTDMSPDEFEASVTVGVSNRIDFQGNASLGVADTGAVYILNEAETFENNGIYTLNYELPPDAEAILTRYVVLSFDAAVISPQIYDIAVFTKEECTELVNVLDGGVKIAGPDYKYGSSYESYFVNNSSEQWLDWRNTNDYFIIDLGLPALLDHMEIFIPAGESWSAFEEGVLYGFDVKLFKDLNQDGKMPDGTEEPQIALEHISQSGETKDENNKGRTIVIKPISGEKYRYLAFRIAKDSEATWCRLDGIRAYAHPDNIGFDQEEMCIMAFSSATESDFYETVQTYSGVLDFDSEEEALFNSNEYAKTFIALRDEHASSLNDVTAIQLLLRKTILYNSVCDSSGEVLKMRFDNYLESLGQEIFDAYTDLSISGADVIGILESVRSTEMKPYETNKVYATIMDAFTILKITDIGLTGDDLEEQIGDAVSILPENLKTTYQLLVEKDYGVAEQFELLRYAEMDYEAITESLEKAMCLSLLSNGNASEIITLLETNASTLGIDLSVLNGTEVKVSDVAKALKGISFKNKDDINSLQETVKEYVEEIQEEKNKTVAHEKTEKRRPSSSSSGGGFSARIPVTKSEEVPAPVVKEEALPFNDLNGYDWAKSSVQSLYAKKIINGVSETQFSPGAPVKREEFVKMIVCALNISSSGGKRVNFTDCAPDDWYYLYVMAAVENSLVQGIDSETFGAGEVISRQDAAVIMNRLATIKKIAIPSAEKQYTDSDAIAEYAVSSIMKMSSAGIINGFEDGSLQPRATVSRAQSAVMIDRLLAYMGGE